MPNPHPDKVYLARFTAPEFTSLCPVTGQPDFAHLVIDYVPRRWLVESKSLKLYLGSFRNHGAFHEDCTLAIADRLVDFLKPRWLRIGGYWYPRGGMPIDVFWQTGRPPADLWIPDQGVAPLPRAGLSGLRCYSRAAFRIDPRDAAAFVRRSFYGGSRRFLRDDQPRTPPGPEGSNGNGDIGRRRGAGAGRLHRMRTTSALRMSYLALARKWRPRNFGELAGQEHVMRALVNALRDRARASRVPVHGHARRRQNDDRAHPGEVAELRDRRDADAVRQVQRLSRDRRRALRRPDRSRRRLAHQGRRHARAARQRAVRAGARPLQGLPHRRSAHAVDALLQCAAEDAGGAAAAREVPARDDRSAEAAGHGAVALPAVQPQALSAGADLQAADGDRRRRRSSNSSRTRCGSSRARPRAACAMR